MTKRVLIYLELNKLKPAGGPYAVGYYIHERLKQLGFTGIEFISCDKINDKPINIKSKNRILKPLKSFWHIIRRFQRYSNMFNKGDSNLVPFNDYDIIHFHTTRSLYECRKWLKDFKGKIIITSHSPVPLAKELYDEQLSKFEKIFFKKMYSKLPLMDEFAFRRADIILFPCREAEEPYYNNWALYNSIHEDCKNKYRYIPTGIPMSIPKRCKSEVFKELSLEEEKDYIITYFGRHNYVKGYDNLKLIGKSVLDRSDNIHFVIGGTEAPLVGLKSHRWHELGWTSDAHSYINASDIFVLPNKETYFDIVMLEVISLGKVVVASRTGGNKFFEKFSDTGIYLYDSIDEAVEIILNLTNKTKAELIAIGGKNIELFKSNFSDQIFVDRYLEFLKGI